MEYTEQVVKLMVPLLKFYFHDDILYYAGHCITKYYTQSCVTESFPALCVFLNRSTGARRRSRVYAPAAGVRAGPRPRVPHPDVALHVRCAHKVHRNGARLGRPVGNHALLR